jgi:hypothetical protein
VSHIHLLEPAALVQEPSRVLRMNGERDLRMPRAGGAGERLAWERLAVAHSSIHALELGLERDAQLRSYHIDRRQPRGRGKHAHPAGSGIDAVDDRDDAAVGLAAPALDIDAHGLGTEGSRPDAAAPAEDPKAPHGAAATAVLIGRNEWTEAEQRGAHDLEFGCRCGGTRFVPAEVLCRG